MGAEEDTAQTPEQRLGEYVRRRREEELGWTRDQVAQRSGLSVGTLRNVERTLRGTFKESTLYDLDRGLGWTAGSAARILAGGEPTIQTSAQAMAAEDDEWTITIPLDPRRKLSPAERGLLEARARLAIERALTELDE